MNKAIGIGLIAVGVILLIFGVSSADSFASDVSRFFTGEPTDRAMWLIIGGVAALAVGAGLTVFSGRALKSA